MLPLSIRRKLICSVKRIGWRVALKCSDGMRQLHSGNLQLRLSRRCLNRSIRRLIPSGTGRGVACGARVRLQRPLLIDSAEHQTGSGFEQNHGAVLLG